MKELFALNSTIVQDGLCPIFLVYGVIPSPARSTSCLTQLQRGRSIDGARREAEKEQAKRRLTVVLANHPGPKGSENMNYLSNLHIGSKVFVYMTTIRTWHVPHTLVSTDQETFIVHMTRGRSIFRSNNLKRAVAPDAFPYDDHPSSNPYDSDKPPLSSDNIKPPILPATTHPPFFRQQHTLQFSQPLQHLLQGQHHRPTSDKSNKIEVTTVRNTLPRNGIHGIAQDLTGRAHQ